MGEGEAASEGFARLEPTGPLESADFGKCHPVGLLVRCIAPLEQAQVPSALSDRTGTLRPIYLAEMYGGLPTDPMSPYEAQNLLAQIPWAHENAVAERSEAQKAESGAQAIPLVAPPLGQ